MHVKQILVGKAGGVSECFLGIQKKFSYELIVGHVNEARKNTCVINCCCLKIITSH